MASLSVSWSSSSRPLGPSGSISLTGVGAVTEPRIRRARPLFSPPCHVRGTHSLKVTLTGQARLGNLFSRWPVGAPGRADDVTRGVSVNSHLALRSLQDVPVSRSATVAESPSAESPPRG